MSDYRLPHDVARCQGQDCPKRTTCLRHLALNDVGPRTPFYGSTALFGFRLTYVGPRTPFYGRLCGGADWTSYLPIEQAESGHE
jgi:hypothetical protein